MRAYRTKKPAPPAAIIMWMLICSSIAFAIGYNAVKDISNYEARRSIQEEAIKRGFAKYVDGRYGISEFQWKEPYFWIEQERQKNKKSN